MEILDFILKIDQNLHLIIHQYPQWIYAIMFSLIFTKTGIGILSFVPGDTLLVALGVILSKGALNVPFCITLLVIAAILGGILNYSMGRFFGKKMINLKFRNKLIFKPKYIEKIQKFYHKYGNKTIIIARFIPILRAFAPFVAGFSKMNYGHFLVYNIIGGAMWVVLYIGIGYFFGNIFYQ